MMPSATVRTPLALREYRAAIEQTHEEGWQRVPLREPLTALANNRRDRTEELPGAVDADLLDARAERSQSLRACRWSAHVRRHLVLEARGTDALRGEDARFKGEPAARGGPSMDRW